MQLFTLHVSGSHHQEHKTVHTASGTVRLILLPAAIVDEMALKVPSHLLGCTLEIYLRCTDICDIRINDKFADIT
jgi:hypothetical protein